MSRSLLFVGLLLLIYVSGCAGPGPENELEEIEAEIGISSGGFVMGEAIPVQYTCDGEDRSPDIAWIHVPEGASSLVLIMDDPDAPGKPFTHWIVYNISPNSTGLSENAPEIRSDRILQGLNDFGRMGYGGPCPPAGKPHRYFFRLYALDTSPDISGKIDRLQIQEAIRGHIIGYGELMGTYQRG